MRGRIDRKYALGLPLDDAGCDVSILCESRRGLIDGSAEQRLLDALLRRCRERGWPKARGRQRTDSTHVLARVHGPDRLECVIEAVRHALDRIAGAAPEWLAARARPGRLERYGRRPCTVPLPGSQQGCRELAEQVSADGPALLEAAHEAGAPRSPREIPAMEAPRRIRIQRYYRDGGGLRWRDEADGLPPAALPNTSPHDVGARFGKQRSTTWIGDKVHLTETCDEDTPHLIVNATTAPAPAPDGWATPEIHRSLRERDLLPGEQIVDAG